MSERSKRLVTGDRNWANVEVIASEMSSWPIETILIHGDARGADRIARAVAETLGMEHRPYPYISELGKRGGPARNRQMVRENIDIVEIVAFHDDIVNSKGTKDMLKVGRAANIPCRLITTAGEVQIPWNELE